MIDLNVVRYRAFKEVQKRHPELKYIGMHTVHSKYSLTFSALCDFKDEQRLEVVFEKRSKDPFYDTGEYLVFGDVNYVFGHERKWVYTKKVMKSDREMSFPYKKTIDAIQKGYKLYPLKWEHFDTSKFDSIMFIKELLNIGCEIKFIQQSHDKHTDDYSSLYIVAKRKKKNVELSVHLGGKYRLKCIVINASGGQRDQYNFETFTIDSAIRVSNIIKRMTGR